MSYAITSDRGKNIASGLAVGGEYTASDGSKWTKQADGSVSVTHNGVTTQNAYTPASGSGKGVSYASAAKNSGTGYSLGTNDGMKAYNSVLETGKSTQLSDGTVLVKGSDGKVYAERAGGGVQEANVTYQPSAMDSNAMAAALMSLYGENNPYTEAQRQQEAATRASVQKAVGDLQRQKTQTNQEYSKLFRQLYLNRMNAEKNIGQQMAAQGVTGGASEQTQLGLATSYAEALRQGEIDRMNAQKDLDKAITDTRLTGDISIAESAAENAIAGANSYAKVLQSLIGRNDDLVANQQTKADAAAEADRKYARTLAETILKNAEMPGDAILAAAGLDKGTALILQKIYTPQPVQNGVHKEKAEMAGWAALRGDTTEYVRSILEEFYGMPFESVLNALRFAYPE